MRLVAVEEETNCMRAMHHCEYCDGVNHVCYRCGLLMGRCSCAQLGSPLDY